MLARHLLFLATRRPNTISLAISTESITPQVIAQPPPYIGPPKPDDRQKSQKYGDIARNTQKNQQRNHIKNDNYIDQQQQQYPRDYSYENNSGVCKRSENSDHHKIPTYGEYQRSCDRRSVQMHNARNQQFSIPGRDINQQFYTLPSRKPQREIEPPRSVTPDITRGLGRGSLSTMHMLAKQGQRHISEQDLQPNRLITQVNANRRNLEQLEARNRLVQARQQSSTVDVRNRFTAPLGLTAFGYRFFASSPVNEPVGKSACSDILKHNSISPITHGYGNGFRSSTPPGRSMPTVAERLALTTGNCSSPIPSSSGRSTPVQSLSGRSTPTNLILSPTKSTMSNEELFAAIHKSKKKLNIKDDGENLSPYGSMNSLVKTPAGSRHSWSPESQKPPEITQVIQSPTATSRLDFKRLLLQQSVKTGPTRLSAAEQLKLSRQQCQPQSPTIVQPTPLAKVLSPRSAWRFQTPRTDVLSSTIIEDTAAEEKAMKPSPENTSPLLRLNTRRQLNLCSYTPDNLPTINHDEKMSETRVERFSTELGKSTTDVSILLEKPNKNILPQATATSECSTINNNDLSIDLKKPCFIEGNSVLDKKISSSQLKNNTSTTGLQYSQNSTSRSQEAISAFESRRLSNQLAKAQFLANIPTNTNQEQSAYFRKRFRARSESPQHVISQNVARSPSAPTLETAL